MLLYSIHWPFRSRVLTDVRSARTHPVKAAVGHVLKFDMGVKIKGFVPSLECSRLKEECGRTLLQRGMGRVVL